MTTRLKPQQLLERLTSVTGLATTSKKELLVKFHTQKQWHTLAFDQTTTMWTCAPHVAANVPLAIDLYNIATGRMEASPMTLSPKERIWDVRSRKYNIGVQIAVPANVCAPRGQLTPPVGAYIRVNADPTRLTHVEHSEWTVRKNNVGQWFVCYTSKLIGACSTNAPREISNTASNSELIALIAGRARQLVAKRVVTLLQRKCTKPIRSSHRKEQRAVRFSPVFSRVAYAANPDVAAEKQRQTRFSMVRMADSFIE